MLIGGIEAGGTKFVCAVANERLEILDKTVIVTREPEETLQEVALFFKSHRVEALTIGAFGPVVVDAQLPNYGMILNTPKLLWQNINLREKLQHMLKDIPIMVQTDVNVAAYGEAHLGAGVDVASLLYLTIGTGIGGGYVVDGKFPATLLHQEMGHILMQRHREDQVKGICPFHGDCLEGLASGYAIQQRSGVPAASLAREDDFWQHWSTYVATALLTYTLTLSPHCIVLGGGVMHQTYLLPMIKERFLDLMNGYVEIEKLITGGLDNYIVPAGLGSDAGIMGALLLSKRLIE